jgi:hypothetical protein
MGNDGRRIAYPSDWKTLVGNDGRLVVIPNIISNDIELVFINADYLAMFKKLINLLSD